MKKIITTLLLIASALTFARAEQTNNFFTTNAAIWAGLDYSMVKMIGHEKSDSAYGFTDGQKIFPAMPERWNRLFLGERIDTIAKALGRDVEVDIGSVTERNKTASKSQIILTTHIHDVAAQPNVTVTDIANAVREYKMEKTSGLGLVFVVDKLIEASYKPPIHSPNSGAVYVVLFDISTRKVLYANREVYEISTGGSFQNFWFGPIKDADETLIKFQLTKKSLAPTIPITPRSR